jgi:hypothetical protein
MVFTLLDGDLDFLGYLTHRDLHDVDHQVHLEFLYHFNRLILLALNVNDEKEKDAF